MKNGKWVEIKLENVEINYSFEKHKPIKLKGLPWLYCKCCGLLYLKNSLTYWCIKMGCNHSYHHTYKEVVKSKSTLK